MISCGVTRWTSVGNSPNRRRREQTVAYADISTAMERRETAIIYYGRPL